MSQLTLFADLGRAHTRRGQTPVHRAKQVRRAEVQLARCEAAEAREPKPPGERTTCYVCSAPCSPHEIGHARCTGRRAA